MLSSGGNPGSRGSRSQSWECSQCLGKYVAGICVTRVHVENGGKAEEEVHLHCGGDLMKDRYLGNTVEISNVNIQLALVRKI